MDTATSAAPDEKAPPLELALATQLSKSTTQEKSKPSGAVEFPNMSQRTIMQYLSLDDWKTAARLPIPAGELMLSRLHNYGWIEIRGEKQHTAVKLTPAGREAMRSAIKTTRRLVEPELKAKGNERSGQTSGICKNLGSGV